MNTDAFAFGSSNRSDKAPHFRKKLWKLWKRAETGYMRWSER